MKIYYLKRLRRRFSWEFDEIKERYLLVDKKEYTILTIYPKTYEILMKRNFYEDMTRYINNPSVILNLKTENEFLFNFMKSLMFHRMWGIRFPLIPLHTRSKTARRR